MIYKLIFLLLTFYCISPAFCQPTFTYISSQRVFGTAIIKSLAKPKASVPLVSPSMLISPNFYSTQLGFFCKQEIKLQKAIKIPFVFRISSVQAVDYLEGKRYAYIGNR